MNSETTTLTIGTIIASIFLGCLHMIIWGLLVGLGFYLAGKITEKIEYRLHKKDVDRAYNQAMAEMPRKEEANG